LASEVAKQQMKVLQGDDREPANVSEIRSRKNRRKPAKEKYQPDKQQQRKCGRCGKTHAWKKCPAWGQTCSKCGVKNHYSGQCRSKEDKVQSVEATHHYAGSDNEEEFFCTVVESNKARQCEWIVTLDVCGSETALKVDSGAQVNILNWSDYFKMKNKPLIEAKTMTLRAYNQEIIPTAGVCHTSVVSKDKQYGVDFVVVQDKNRQSILGANDAERLGLISRADDVKKVYTVACKDSLSMEKLVKQHGDVFQGLGCLEGKCSIKLVEDAVPSIHPARKVPIALKGKLKEEIERLVDIGVLEKTEEPTDWVLPLVIVEKTSGALRICMDPLDLNKYIRREHHYLPHKSEILSEMAGAQYFSKLDASQGFYHLQLDEKSIKLCTVATPHGRYSFRRMPFGICSAPEIFHAKIQQLFENEAGIKVFMDDVIIWGSSIEEHDARVRKAIEIVRKAGIKLNKKKCEIAVTEVTYLGEKLNREGVQPDPQKVAAIVNMPDPQCKEDVQRALGMVNYLSKFVPNMSVKTTALRQLLLSDSEWLWDSAKLQEWQNLKDILTKQPVLKFFDPQRKTKVSSDSSKDGLGAVLLQQYEDKWWPIVYASRSLTSAERNYAQIEKELLGIVFACDKFYEFVYGASVIAETDHKPLLSLHKKSLCELTPRLQRLMLRLRRYDLTLEYLPGKFLIIADTLSRAFQQGEDGGTDEEVKAHVDMIKSSMQVSDPMWDKLASSTSEDSTLKEVLNAVHNGWETSGRTLKPYYHMRADITEIDGVLVKGKKVIVPAALRQEMLTKLHEGHLGIEKCQARARQVLYWPGISRDIENLVKKCSVCQEFQSKQQKEPLQQHEVPQESWQKVGADLCQMAGQHYLVVVDYRSNYPEIARLEDQTASCTIKHMKAILARHGLPKTVCTDNGPQFDCREFKLFAKEYGFQHDTSSPHYAQSNGKAESAVKIVKRLVNKARKKGEDPYMALLNYRATPLKHGKSPAEICMGRQINTKLPSVKKHLDAKIQHVPSAKSKGYYDKGAKTLPKITEGNIVRLWADGKWTRKAKVLHEVAPNSYLVLTEEGRVLRRNRRHLLRTKEEFRQNPDIPIVEGATNMPVAPMIPTDPQGTAVPITAPSRQPESPPRQPESPPRQPERPPESPPKQPAQAIITTRSGRVVKRPKKLEEYQ
jgi:hypothetical protein